MLLFIFNFYSLLSCGQLVIYEAFVFASQKPGLLPTHLYFLVSPWKCCHLGLQSSQKKRNSERSNFVNFVVPGGALSAVHVRCKIWVWEYCTQCAPTHPIDREVHLFPRCKRYDHCTHCTVSPYSVNHVPFMASCLHHCYLHPIKW